MLEPGSCAGRAPLGLDPRTVALIFRQRDRAERTGVTVDQGRSSDTGFGLSLEKHATVPQRGTVALAGPATRSPVIQA